MRTTTFLVVLLFLATDTPRVKAEEAVSRSVHVIDEVPAHARPNLEASPDLALLDADPNAKINNPSGLAIEILPRNEVRLGETLAFRISTNKPGFLILLDIDSDGRLTQIYPNEVTLSDPKGIDAELNLILPKRPINVPDASNGSFEFVATQPPGVGMIVAILSNDPLQVVDLPDVPMALVGSRKAMEFLLESAKSLKIVSLKAPERLKAPKWSFTTRFYVIR